MTESAPEKLPNEAPDPLGPDEPTSLQDAMNQYREHEEQFAKAKAISVAADRTAFDAKNHMRECGQRLASADRRLLRAAKREAMR